MFDYFNYELFINKDEFMDDWAESIIFMVKIFIVITMSIVYMFVIIIMDLD